MSDLPSFQIQVKAVGRMLANIGYDADDFEIKADKASPLAQLFRLAGGLLVVRRRSTGEERFYATDSTSIWADTLMNDLAHGALSGPPAATVTDFGDLPGDEPQGHLHS